MSAALTVTGLLLASALLAWGIWRLVDRWLRRRLRKQQEETFLAGFRLPVGEEEKR